MADQDELKLKLVLDTEAFDAWFKEYQNRPAEIPIAPSGTKGGGKGTSSESAQLKRDIQTRIDLIDLEARTMQRSANEQIKSLQQRAAAGKITTNEMVAGIQLQEAAQERATQLAINGYAAVEKQIAQTTQLTLAQSVALEKKLFYAQERASTGFVSMSRSMGGLQSNTKDANIAFANFGRIVQDAPFGLLGISNNIDPLLNSFAQLKASTGGTGLALRALGAQLLGPAGLIFLLGSLLPTALLFAQKAMAKNREETDKSKKSLTDYEQALRSSAQTQLSDAIPATLTYTEQLKAFGDALSVVSKTLAIQKGEIANANSFFKQGRIDVLGYMSAQQSLAMMSETTRKALFESSQQVFGATIQEDEAVREIIQSKINEAKANQAIEDALKRLNITRRKSAEELRKEQLEQIDRERTLLELQFIRESGEMNAFQRFMRERVDTAKELASEEADARLNEANRVGEGEITITKQSILEMLGARRDGIRQANEAQSSAWKLRLMLLEDEQRGLIEMMDMTTLIARNTFGDTKAVAVAEALVNTYVGVSRALREYAPPLSGIMAGLQLANGLATVNRIKNTKIGDNSVSQSRSTTSTATVAPVFDNVRTTSGTSAMFVASSTSNPNMYQPNLNINANVDRQGIAIAVREGEAEIRSQQIAFS